MNNQDRLILDKEQLNDLVNSCQKEIVYEYKRISTEYSKSLNKLNELKESDK